MNINIPDNFFTEDEINKLMNLFQVTTNEQFVNAINKITLAALNEYKEMLLGETFPTRADEIKQHRLLYLIKNYFDGYIPTENDIAPMFHLTESESKSLLKKVHSRFRFQLETEINNNLIRIINSAEQPKENNNYYVNIPSDNTVNELNQIIRVHQPNNKLVTRVQNTANRYEIANDTYNFLSNYFNLQNNRGE